METCLGALLALAAVREHVGSARPDAPVVDDPPLRNGSRIVAVHVVRSRTAGVLHRLADWVWSSS
ncbi:hypothetical protein EF879_09985 [Micromonospora sp. HM5-17]|nr:hypothetical protein EF879_09985 [Micromonospora sp. HM5-17]